MEDVLESLGRFIFRIIKWVLIEAVLETFIYWYGRITLKVVTLGRYPKLNEEAKTRCIVAGIISIVLTLFLIAFLF